MGHSRPSHFAPVLNNVRYASDSDHSRYESELTLWANKRHMQCNKNRPYSITSSASAMCIALFQFHECVQRRRGAGRPTPLFAEKRIRN
jgi:hypothetical protein